MRYRQRRVLASWIVLFTLFNSMLAPLVSQVLATHRSAAAHENEVCTGAAAEVALHHTMPVPSDERRKPERSHGFAHCPLCLPSGSHLALLSGPMVIPGPRETRLSAPIGPPSSEERPIVIPPDSRPRAPPPLV